MFNTKLTCRETNQNIFLFFTFYNATFTSFLSIYKNPINTGFTLFSTLLEVAIVKSDISFALSAG